MNGAVARQRASWLAAALVLAALLSACSGANANPSPSPSFTLPPPSPTPSVTADANGRALPGFVTVSTELPAAQSTPAGLLAQSGPGWSVQTYRPQVESVTLVTGVTPGFGATVQVVYLVSPQGQRYQLLELDPAVPVVIESWTAGEPVAYVRQCNPLDCDPAALPLMLDLLTGELTPVDGVDADLHVGATLPGSVRWWQDGVDRAALDKDGATSTFARGWTAASSSPAGNYLAVTRTDAASPYASAGMAILNVENRVMTDLARLWPEPLTCEPFRWRADGALDVSCWDAQQAQWRLFAVGPGAQEMKENKSASATPPEEGPWVQPDFFVSDGVWAGPFTADASARLMPLDDAIGLARNAGFEQLVVPDAGVGSARVVAVAAGLVFVEATQANNLTLTSAWAYDPLANTWAELGSLPPGGPTRGLLATQGSPASGMTSWAIAP